MSKDKWKQIGGDMTWENHGGVFARDDGRGVDIVRVDSWAELDSSAIPTHGLYNSQEDYFDYDDLAEGILPGALPKNVKDALRSSGMDEEEYAKLEPVHKAEVLASYQGYGGDDKSSNDLLELLPDDPENIEFWGGKETKEKVRGYNDDARRDAVRDHFKSRMSWGEWPSKKTFDFAFGDDDFEMKLSDDDTSAFGYAMAMAGIKKHGPDLSLDKEDFKKVVEALAKAPGGEDLVPATMNKLKHYLGHQIDDEEQLKEMAEEMAEGARSLASSMMETLGIEWV
jgi:hypothetical protein